MNTRILLFLVTLLLVPLLTYFVILFARGYRPSSVDGGSLQPTGILAANSLPTGAQLYINNQFKSATDTNLNLSPGTYEIEIKKDTYFPWKKTVQIKPEEVTRASAVLFPTVPVLKAITTTGASLPIISPDGTKVAYVVDGLPAGRQVYTLDLSESPLGLLNRDPKLVHSLPAGQAGSEFTIHSLIWSPDSKQILAQSTPSAYLVDINQQSAKLVASPIAILNQWNEIQIARKLQKFSTLPLRLQNILATAAAELIWSPKENKVMYAATASAVIVDNLIRQLPGSSTQPQERQIKPGSIYVYDLEEDRNFKISQSLTGLGWFPTSNHLVQLENGKVTVLEYDGGNPTVVYMGPMENGYAFPYPSSRQLLVLANLNQAISKVANLYAVSLH